MRCHGPWFTAEEAASQPVRIVKTNEQQLVSYQSPSSADHHLPSELVKRYNEMVRNYYSSWPALLLVFLYTGCLTRSGKLDIAFE